MTENGLSQSSLLSRPKTGRAVLLTALIVTFLLVVFGAALRADPGGSCPDWPTCFGTWSLPPVESARLDFAHRALAALSGFSVLAAVLVARRVFPGRAAVNRPLTLALLLAGVEVLLGGWVALNPQAAYLSPLHLGFAILTLGLVAYATTAAYFTGARLALPRFGSPFARLTLVTLGAVFAVMLTGSLVSATGAGQACMGWPLCAGGLPSSPLGWVDLFHRFLTAAASGLILAQFIRAWKSQRTQPVQLVTATGVFVLFLGQVMVGGLKVSRGFPADLVGLHAAASAALWAVQVILATAAGLAGRTRVEEAAESTQPLPFGRRVKDFILLSKPIIVALLLVTTYAGMVVGGQQIPGLLLTFWTMLGGALAAGGSSALNQYIDRDVDGEMQRTARRPLPAGRLQPAEGLAYGLAACLAAFFILAGFVNLLAAVLSLAGMIYYVLIYSIWLKRLTVQNIVIGGGAGAIPPLVGWAAATGSLNIPALLLFAIVFLWTPPHFWALALVRRNDYARASIPMLPVVRGEAATRWQIFIYSLELVALTMLMPIFHVTGSVYLISAAVLGAYLIYSAWKVLKQGGNKNAWKLYKYTSMYLMLLFLALVVDVLI